MLFRRARTLALAASAGLAGLLAAVTPAAALCLNPDAIGVSRILTVDTSRGLEVGRSQYPRSLALQPKEVVLTFDDGPAPANTDAVLKALDDQCVKATFFVVGSRAALHPDLVAAAAAAGHTIGTHSQNHLLDLQLRSVEEGIREIDVGIASTAKALGRPPAPFFRFPGLGHTKAMRAHVAAIGVGVFSIDAEGGDWMGFLGPDRIRARSIAQLKEHDGGILLLHDALRNTAAMLPDLLRDLKAQGFRIVHIVPGETVSPAFAAVAAATPPRLSPPPRPIVAAAAPTALANAATPAAATRSAPSVVAVRGSSAPVATPSVFTPPRPTAPYLTPTTGDD